MALIFINAIFLFIYHPKHAGNASYIKAFNLAYIKCQGSDD